MVLKDYLKEDLIFSKDIPQAYLYLGNNINGLMKETPKIEFALTRKEGGGSKVVATVSEPTAVGNSDLRHIHDRCYSDLLDLCRTIAAARNVTMASIMNIQALKAMAEELPTTEKDMCAIPHVTKANFDKYGAKLLEITNGYALEKDCLQVMQDIEATETSEAATTTTLAHDDNSWAQAAALQGAGGSSGGMRGGKRKRAWRGRATGAATAKRYKSAAATASPAATRKKATPARAARGAGSSAASKRGAARGGSSSWLGKKQAPALGFN